MAKKQKQDRTSHALSTKESRKAAEGGGKKKKGKGKGKKKAKGK